MHNDPSFHPNSSASSAHFLGAFHPLHGMQWEVHGILPTCSDSFRTWDVLVIQPRKTLISWPYITKSTHHWPQTRIRQSSNNLTKSTTPPKQNSFLFSTCSFAELLWLQKPYAWNFGTPWHFRFHHDSAFISHHKSAAKATSAKAVHWSLASLALGVALVPSSFPVSAPAQAVSPGFRNPATSSRT